MLSLVASRRSGVAGKIVPHAPVSLWSCAYPDVRQIAYVPRRRRLAADANFAGRPVWIIRRGLGGAVYDFAARARRG